MMAGEVSFEDLALKYILLDKNENDAAEAICREAAGNILKSEIQRKSVGQWASSIQRWMPLGEGQEDELEGDIIARAKALDFLAGTLKLLPRDFLKHDQVQLLVGFFNSLFSSDHKAGISAAVKALQELLSMRAFQAASAQDMIDSVVQLGEDFARQPASSRLLIYDLLRTLFGDEKPAQELRISNHASQYFPKLVDMCRTERDPENLVKWFGIQQLFLKRYSPTQEVASEIFKSFSNYFPITMKSSTTPSGLTVDDLKASLRVCFAANPCLASQTIPFLISKLDHGEAVSVSVKVEIMRTIGSCISSYSDRTASIAAFATQIWSSLRYEVRNGQVEDTVEETLKTIMTLVRCLNGPDLKQFVANSWIDIVDDLSEAKYASQAGQLITAIAGATPESFHIAAPLVLDHVTGHIFEEMDSKLGVQLIIIVNSMLMTRTVFNSPDGDSNFHDLLFGDKLYEDLYASIWHDSLLPQNLPNRLEMIPRVSEGIESLVSQKTSDHRKERLCSASVCQSIGQSLTSIFFGTSSKEEDRHDELSKEKRMLTSITTSALKAMAPLYPEGCQHLLSQLSASIPEAWFHIDGRSSLPSLAECSISSTQLICTNLVTLDGASPISNCVCLINVLLDILNTTPADAEPQYFSLLINTMIYAMVGTLEQLNVRLTNEERENLKVKGIMAEPNAETLFDFMDSLPRIDLDRRGDLLATSSNLNQQNHDAPSSWKQFLFYCLFVVKQLYRRFTDISMDDVGGRPPGQTWSIDTSIDLRGWAAADKDAFLARIGRMATVLIRELSVGDQTKLNLWLQAFVAFHDIDLDAAPLSMFSEVCNNEIFNIVPLITGVFCGLWPEAILYNDLPTALMRLISTCFESALGPIPPSTLTNLDLLITVVANKSALPLPDQGLPAVDTIMTTKVQSLLQRHEGTNQHKDHNIWMFRRILCCVVGRMNRPNPGKVTSALREILEIAASSAPREPTMGRDLAQSFDLLFQDRECLDKVNHGLKKKLFRQYIYETIIRKHLVECFPSPKQNIDARVASNFTIMVFSALKYLNYSEYAHDVEDVVRICVLATSTGQLIDTDFEAVFGVLLQVLEDNPRALEPHLTSLIANTRAVYEMARSERHNNAAGCRLLGIKFLGEMPEAFGNQAQKLMPHQPAVVRCFIEACGDPVREVRDAAREARFSWNIETV